MVKKKKVNKKGKKTSSKMVRASKKKINLVVKNLILFAVLTITSFILHYFLGEGVIKDLLYFSSMILGFIAIAFLITFLILYIMKLSKK
jgi:polyferredoxin